MTLAEQLATLLEQGQDQPRHRVDAAAELRRLRAEVDQLRAAWPPAYYVTVSGRLHETEPTALAFELHDGRHPLYVAPVAPVKRHCETCAHEPLATSAPPCTVCCAAPYGKFPMWTPAGAAK